MIIAPALNPLGTELACRYESLRYEVARAIAVIGVQSAKLLWRMPLRFWPALLMKICHAAEFCCWGMGVGGLGGGGGSP